MNTTGCHSIYPRCSMGCSSPAHHRAIFAAISNKPKVVIEKKKSSKINYEALAKFLNTSEN